MVENKKGLLSVCCLGYNHAKFLEKNITSIWRSSYKNIEIIVVDDGSKDDSKQILQRLKKQSPFPMKLVFQENVGNVGANFNRAISLASGEFISFISLDDYLYSDAIDKAIAILKQDNKIVFVASSVISVVDGNGNVVKEKDEMSLFNIVTPSADDVLNLEYNEFHSFYLQGSFFRRIFVDAVGGFDEDQTGDDIVLRTKIARYVKDNPELRFVMLREPLCHYRRHGSNVSSNVIRQYKIISQYLQKYWKGYPYPKRFSSDFLFFIKNQDNSLRDVYRFIFLNGYTLGKLKNFRVIKYLLVRFVKIFLHLIYKRTRIDDNTRKVVLFSVFPFIIKKKR